MLNDILQHSKVGQKDKSNPRGARGLLLCSILKYGGNTDFIPYVMGTVVVWGRRGCLFLEISAEVFEDFILDAV